MPASDKYTDPELREEVKEEIQAGDKGGAPGQWSARKAQMMASEYKKRGGGYTTDKKDKDESQKNLDKWGDEEWQTKEGSGSAKQADGSQKRYLPKKAWEEMTEEEREETDQKKLDEGKGGKKQFVENTEKAKEARKKATTGGHEDDVTDDGGTENEKGTGARKGATEADGGPDPAEDDDEYDPNGDDPAAVDEAADVEEDSTPRRSTRKRSTAPTSTDKGTDKKRKTEDGQAEPASNSKKDVDKPPSKGKKETSKGGKKANGKGGKGKRTDADEMEEDGEDTGETYGSKHDSKSPPEGTEQATKDNLPKKGDQVHWKAMPGWCTGKVDQILTSTKTIEGKSHNATKDDPRIVIRSDGPSGKLAIHKVDKVYISAH